MLQALASVTTSCEYTRPPTFSELALGNFLRLESRNDKNDLDILVLYIAHAAAVARRVSPKTTLPRFISK